jgi:hypothetical protein
LYDVSGGYVISPLAVKRSFAPPRTSTFVSTHTFVPSKSISDDLMLPAVAGADCARTAGPRHTMAAAPNTNAANLIPVFLFTIPVAFACLGPFFNLHPNA